MEDLIKEGKKFLEAFKEDNKKEIGSTELREWLSETILELERSAGKSKLMEVTETVKVFMSEKDDITFNQFEMIYAFLKGAHSRDKKLAETLDYTEM